MTSLVSGLQETCNHRHLYKKSCPVCSKALGLLRGGIWDPKMPFVPTAQKILSSTVFRHRIQNIPTHMKYYYLLFCTVGFILLVNPLHSQDSSGVEFERYNPLSMDVDKIFEDIKTKASKGRKNILIEFVYRADDEFTRWYNDGLYKNPQIKESLRKYVNVKVGLVSKLGEVLVATFSGQGYNRLNINAPCIVFLKPDGKYIHYLPNDKLLLENQFNNLLQKIPKSGTGGFEELMKLKSLFEKGSPVNLEYTVLSLMEIGEDLPKASEKLLYDSQFNKIIEDFRYFELLTSFNFDIDSKFGADFSMNFDRLLKKYDSESVYNIVENATKSYVKNSNKLNRKERLDKARIYLKVTVKDINEYNRIISAIE